MLIVDPNKRITIKEIMDNKWFKIGFKKDQTNASMQKLKVSDEDVDKAMKETAGEEESNEPVGGGNTTGELNAFDLASRLMMGSMNPLMSNTAVKIRRETRFMASGAQKNVEEELIKVLGEMKANPERNVKNKEIKGYINTSNSQMLTFTAKVEGLTGGLCMVEVRRGKGDILEYNSFYRNLVKNMGNTVVSKETS